MHLLNLKSKYAPSGNKSFGMVSSKINSTHKWVEYSLDINDMQKMLMATKNINEKFQIMELLEIAERKKSWHYKKENFNGTIAGRLLQAVLSAPRKVIS
jgi:hypothetical protein|tara:strand:- start:183 stop:479 length:297 start_codon:yes stop_codon:yes gene_type:complete